MRGILLVTGGVLAVALCLPLGMSASGTVIASKMLVYALFAIAFNLLAGRAGMLSFGHAAYFGVGIFATLHLMKAAEHGFALATPLLPLAGAAAGLLVGAISGIFATMRSGVYFSMITLAIAELMFSVAPSLPGLFGGEVGITSARMPWMGIAFGNPVEVYYVVVAWVLAASGLLFLYNLTPFGRLTLALRENETRARFLGYNTYHTRILVFSISAMFSGLAGGLLAFVDESANYVQFDTGASALVVLNTFIGGSAVFIGPAIGAMLLTAFGYLVSDMTPMVLLYQGVLFILLMIFAPQGVCGVMAQHQDALAQGWWKRLVLSYLMALVPAAALTAAAVFSIELLQRLFALDYWSAAVRTGVWPPLVFMRHAWDPLSVLTWCVPLALGLVGAVSLPPVRHRIRSAWDQHA